MCCNPGHALCDLDRGVYGKYRLDSSLFNLCRLNANTKTFKKLILEALFANDCALMAHTEHDLQVVVKKFAEATRLFDLTISLAKTKVLHQPAPGTTAKPPSITIDGTEPKSVRQFKYLGSIMSSESQKHQAAHQETVRPGHCTGNTSSNWNVSP